MMLAQRDEAKYTQLVEQLLAGFLSAEADNRRYFVREWLFDGVPVIMHDTPMPPHAPLFELSDGGSRIHLYAKGQYNLITQLKCAVTIGKNLEDKGRNEVIVRETDAAPPPKGEAPKKPQQGTGGNKTLYDPTAASVAVEEGRKIHTARDLRLYAQMRSGESNLSEDEMAARYASLNQQGNISHKKDERKRENIGGRWLWEQLHAYLLDERTLEKKTPGRWFRDMCVINGVSTTILSANLVQAEGVAQRILTEMQLDSYSIQKTAYSNTVLKHLRTALSLCLPKAVPAGYGSKTGAKIINSYTMPAGSAFGLPTIKGEDGTEKVDHDVVEKLLKGLFREHYVGVSGERHVLQHIKHVSDAYQEGAISRQEVLATNLTRKDGKLYRLMWQYGLKSQYSSGSVEYDEMTRVFFREGTQITALCENLRQLNKKHWKMPNVELEAALESFRWLPASQYSIFTNGMGHDQDAAWDYATKHHDGKIRKLLNAYREARGMLLKDLPLVADGTFTYVTVGQYENGERLDSTTCNRALSYKSSSRDGKRSDERYYDPHHHPERIENLFDLPMNEDRTEIRGDVIDYITEHFVEKTVAHKKPEAHWITLSKALEQVNDGGDYSTGENVQRVLKSRAKTFPRRVIAEQLALYPDEPFPLITLPNGAEVLVKRGNDKEEPKLLESDLPMWQAWLLDLPSPRRYTVRSQMSMVG